MSAASPDPPSARVLVVNAGSSSLKYGLADLSSQVVQAQGTIERIGGAGGPDHGGAVRQMLERLTADGPDLLEAVAAVGHRIVHGGERFREPTLVDDDVLDAIDDLSVLAPLHNPAGAAGIRALRDALPDVPQVAVFDTAFHATLPPRAFTYAVPREWRERHGVRRYGFHGTSHASAARAAARHLGRPESDVNVIVLHLGNGASACAVLGGRSIDTSMGMTPLGGLVMGTRSGDVDPAVFAHLERVAGLTAQDVDRDLTRRSGLKGLTGDGDVREVVARAGAGDADAELALDVYCYRVRSYVGAYTAVLGRVDAVVLTAGVGEHSAVVRSRSLAGLERLGIELDEHRNVAVGTHDDGDDGTSDGAGQRVDVISTDASPVTVLVVPADEESEIARQALAVVRDRGVGGG